MLRGWFDGLMNLTANLGTSRDKAASGFYAPPMNDQTQLLNAYRSSWLAKKIVNIPAVDSVRVWREWQASKDEITAIEKMEKKLQLRSKVLRARIAARLWGGSALLIGTAERNLRTPLNVERIGLDGLKYVTMFPSHRLAMGAIDDDPASEWFGLPSTYHLSFAGGQRMDIHPSRLAIFRGAELPDNFMTYGTWSDSVLLSAFEAIRNADSASANTSSLIYESKVDIIKIPDLMKKMVNPEWEAQVLRRLSLAATAKGNNGMLLMDSEEEYDQKTNTFGGLSEVLDRMFQAAAGAADIPMTRLFGISPGGMNATGQSDLQNYYDSIRAGQELEITPEMSRLDDALIRSALGSRPEEIHYNWANLWQPTAKERAEVGEAQARTIKTLSESGLFNEDMLAKAGSNAIIEAGTLPGLEAAIDEFGLEPEEEDPVDLAAAAGLPVKVPGEQTPEDRRAQLKAVGDAAPRTLYVSRRVVNASEILRWAEEQGIGNLMPAGELHVTVAFSRTPLDWMAAGESWSPRLEIGAGGPRIMEQFGEATVLLFSAEELQWRHRSIREAGASWDHPDYQPHITLGYNVTGPALEDIEPYTGRIVLGPEIFAEIDENWKEKLT